MGMRQECALKARRVEAQLTLVGDSTGGCRGRAAWRVEVTAVALVVAACWGEIKSVGDSLDGCRGCGRRRGLLRCATQAAAATSAQH